MGECLRTDLRPNFGLTSLPPSATSKRTIATRLAGGPAAAKTRLALVSILARLLRSPQGIATVTRTGRSIGIWRYWAANCWRVVVCGRSQPARRPQSLAVSHRRGRRLVAGLILLDCLTVSIAVSAVSRHNSTRLIHWWHVIPGRKEQTADRLTGHSPCKRCPEA